MLVQLQISHTLQAGSCNSLRLTSAENSSVIPAALHVGGGLTQGVEAERVEKLRRRGRTAEVRAASSSLGAGGGRTRGRRDDELSLRVWMHAGEMTLPGVEGTWPSLSVASIDRSLSETTAAARRPRGRRTDDQIGRSAHSVSRLGGRPDSGTRSATSQGRNVDAASKRNLGRRPTRLLLLLQKTCCSPCCKRCFAGSKSRAKVYSSN